MWFGGNGREVSTPLLSTDASRWTQNHKEGRLTSSSRIDMQLGQQMIRAAPNRCCLAHRCLLRFSDQCASAVYAPELAKRVRRCQCSLEPGPFQASLNPSCFPSPNINHSGLPSQPHLSSLGSQHLPVDRRAPPLPSLSLRPPEPSRFQAWLIKHRDDKGAIKLDNDGHVWGAWV